MFVRRSDERGHANHGWLDSHHTFSFANYHDPRFMGFGALRVINEDRVAPGRGFGKHPHKNMEIISYVVEGALAHEDSLGSGSTLTPGEVQVMSAGTGVTHSEFNASPADPLHFLQIWILPAEQGTKPRYDQKRFDWEERTNQFAPVVSPDGRAGSLAIGQDATIYSARLDAGQSAERTLAQGRLGWVQVVRGAIEVEGVELTAGDAAAFDDAAQLSFTAVEDAELLFFDLVR